MKAILSFSPKIDSKLIWFKQIENCEVLRTDNPLFQLVKKKYQIYGNITFLGRDNLRRIEIEIPIDLFLQLKNDPLFISYSKFLRRIRIINYSLFNFIVNGNIRLIDNDLDNPIFLNNLLNNKKDILKEIENI